MGAWYSKQVPDSLQEESPVTLFFVSRTFDQDHSTLAVWAKWMAAPDGVTLGLPPTSTQHVLPGCSGLMNGRSKQKPYKFRSQGFVSVPWVKTYR